MKETALFKFNGGLGALLCSECKVIMKIGRDFTEEEKKAIKGHIKFPPQYLKGKNEQKDRKFKEP